MRPSRSRAVHSSDAVFLGLLAGTLAALLIGALVALRGCGEDRETPRQVDLTWTATPIWTEKDPPPARSFTGHDLAIYLDVSQPLGGFFPPAARAHEPSGLRALSQLVQDHLLGVAGTAGSQIAWVRVAEAVEPFAGPPRLERRLFRGRQSRIDLALAQLTRSVLEGRVEAGALITDLNQSEGVTGPLGTVQAMADWLGSARLRKGELHAAVLGVRAGYWGVRGSGCAVFQGDLGCWFSERRNHYFPLSHPAQVPIYALIFGRGRRTVEEVATRVRSSLETLGLKPQWELLSAGALAAQMAGRCELREAGPDRRPQFALARDQDGRWRCIHGDRVTLSCPLPTELQLTNIRVTSSWSGNAVTATAATDADGRVGGQRIDLTLDCAQLRDRPPQGDLVLHADGELAPLSAADTGGIWKDWTSPSDEREVDLSRTPQLGYFLARVRLRPSRRTLTSSVLLTMAEGPVR